MSEVNNGTQNTGLTTQNQMTELSQKLMEETRPDEIEKIVNLFNLNIQKKNIIRSATLSDLQDKITVQMDKRLTKYADEFSNKDLLEYMKTIQTTLDSSKNIEELPQIQVNQQEVNINITSDDGLNRESRERVTNFVRSFLQKAQEGGIQTDAVEEMHENVINIDDYVDAENNKD